MYLTYKKNMVRNRNNPVMLLGNGSFGYSQKPLGKYANVMFLANDGILAVPMIRGGGELGAEWYNQGKKLNKQNTFDDFIGAAEFLINNGYTNKERIIIRGSGLLIGASITQRPELFKVAIGERGIYDMLRYHLFTSGRFGENEYGTIEDSLQFENLLKYSPLQNVRDHANYPATLLLVSENDDQAPAFHTYKFLYAIQKAAFNNKPHILYSEKKAGHYGASKFADKYETDAFILAFIFHQLGIIANIQF